jgi:hypothetical protein
MDGQGRWLSFPDAATALGVSVRSVRRYVQEGRYVTRWSEGVREVLLAEDRPLPSPDSHMPSVDNEAPSEDGQVYHGGQGRPSEDSPTPRALAAEGAAVDALVDLLHEALDGKSAAEQAAAMWQERARNLEAENGRLQELLALPMHEEEQELRPRWWRFWQSR